MKDNLIKRLLITILAISPIIIFADQITKWFVLKNFLPGSDFFIIGKILSISIFNNRGVAFGLPLPQALFYILSGIIIIILFYIYIKYLSKERKWYLDLAIGLIVGGAISNVVDRIRLGYVVDFINFQIWPVFNVADVFIVMGAGILIIKILTGDKSKSINSKYQVTN